MVRLLSKKLANLNRVMLAVVTLGTIAFATEAKAQSYEVCPGCRLVPTPLFPGLEHERRRTNVLKEGGVIPGGSITKCADGSNYTYFGYATMAKNPVGIGRDVPSGGFSGTSDCILAIVYSCGSYNAANPNVVYVPVYGLRAGPNGCFPRAPAANILAGLPQ